MDTKPLERFATWARRELITVVDAQASAVLASGSVARTERPDTVRRLKSEIERHGRQHVIDKVAYTWFNRIIALRFMDARGYTVAGIVSPAQGQEHGQPEVLADAKRGNLDPDVITSTRTADAILGLLDGTRHSTDAEGEAYALLLTEYCRYWHKSMPFMFEREGDYTELLVPANLLADGAILSRAREALTEDVCDDVEVIGWLYQFYISERKDEVFAGFKNNKKAGADEIPAATQLFTPHWIVRYLVENSIGRLWMLNRPASRLVEQMDYYIAPVENDTDFLKVSGPEELTLIDPACGSGHILTYAFDLLYAIYDEAGYAPSEIPALILAHNLFGTEIDPRAGALAAFALAMKARSRQRTFFSKEIVPNICVIESISFGSDELVLLVTEEGDRRSEEGAWNQFEHADTFGALIRTPASVSVEALKGRVDDLSSMADDLFKGETLQRASRVVMQAQYLARFYAAIVGNPPYMGAGNMGAELTTWVTENYPVEKQDLYACFVRLAFRLALPGAHIAMIIGDTWLALPSFSDFRRALLEISHIENLVHLDDVSNHPDIFGANTAFVISAGVRESSSQFIALEDNSHDLKDAKLRIAASGKGGDWVHNIHQDVFKEVPGTVFAYKLTEEELSAFASGVRLGDIASLREGINTGENERFLRFWWEVGFSRTTCGRPFSVRPDQRWVVYKKGGAYRKWAGNAEFVVNWADNGAEIRDSPRSTPRNTQHFFKPSASWSRISSGEFSLRYYGEGFAFDSTGPSAFGDEQSLNFALAFLNSNLAKRFLAALSPTLDYRLGNMGNLPGPQEHEFIQLDHVGELVSIAQADWDERETAWGFAASPLISANEIAIDVSWMQLKRSWDARVGRTLQLEALNNASMAEVYGLHHIDSAPDRKRVSLWCNPEFVFAKSDAERRDEAFKYSAVADLVSYGIGCVFGRYSLDEPGLILADQERTLANHFANVPYPTLEPDADNVIPVVDSGWFEDDIVERFRQFLRAAFGAQNFENNLRFVEESLGVTTLRDYFISKAGKSKFYDDHVQRYKKRPIYWMFSSPKGSFNALIYMHRYTPSTVSTVLNEYLREYRAKLEVALADAESAAAGGSVKDQKEADRLRKVLVELAEYEHDVLYPLATRQLPIDLDDGVLVNYLRFGRALKEIGLEKDRRKVEGWTWPRYPLEAAQ